MPENVEYTLLFDHGNRAVAENLRALDMPRKDWQRTMIYSWIEFDGTVYLFQNALTGIEQLMRLATGVMADQPVNDLATFAAALANRNGPTEVRVLRQGEVQRLSVDLHPR